MLSPACMFAQVRDDAQRRSLERGALEQLVAGMRTALIIAFIGPVLIGTLTVPVVGWVAGLGPMALLYVIAIERVFFVRRVTRVLDTPDGNARPWLAAFAWRTGASGLVILVGFYPVMTTGNDALIFLLLALGTVVSASSMAQFCCWPPAMWASFTPILLGMGLQLLLLGGLYHALEALFVALLWLTLGMAGVRFGRALHNDMATRLLNENLLRELDLKRRQAEAAHAAKSQFFAAASHDLRQPLQAMNLYLSVLGDGEHDDKTVARLNECMSALDRLLGVVLDLSRLDSGQIVPERKTFALQPLLERQAAMYEAAARHKGLQLRIHPTMAWTTSDPALLERVLSNLLTNAIRYTQRGGVLLGVRRDGRDLRIEVVDTGIGIPAEAQGPVFEEFVQLDNPARDPAKGYGLGLSTVRRIANLLGHPVSVRSRVGRGSVFALRLPSTAPCTEQQSSAVETTAAWPLFGRVLVVEDNPLVRDALVRMLEGWGLEVQCAEDAREASGLFARHRFEVVLSDWRLPGPRDGLSVLREARECVQGLRLAVLLTGEDVQALGAVGREFPVLRKPLRPLRLRTLLSHHLRVHPGTAGQSD